MIRAFIKETGESITFIGILDKVLNFLFKNETKNGYDVNVFIDEPNSDTLLYRDIRVNGICLIDSKDHVHHLSPKEIENQIIIFKEDYPELKGLVNLSQEIMDMM